MKFYVYLGDLMEKSLGDFDLLKATEYAKDLLARRKYLEAIPFFETLSKELEEDFWFENLASMYHSLKREDEQIATLKAHVRVNPKSLSSKNQLRELATGYDTAAANLLTEGRKPQAIEQLVKAVKIQESPERWVQLSELYQDMDEENLANRALKRWKALTTGPVKQATSKNLQGDSKSA